MFRLLSLSLLMFSGMAHAVVCKTINEEGVVSYTDVPVEECANPITLPDYSRYAPRPIGQYGPGSSAGSAATGETPFDGYASLSIVQPAAGEVVRSNEGEVPLSLQLTPELHPGHQITVYLDGRVVPSSFSGTAMVLTGVERGAHSVQVRISDASGQRLIESESVGFTLHKVGPDDSAAVSISVDKITSDDFISADEAAAGGDVAVTGSVENAPSGTTVNFTVNGSNYSTNVKPDGTWSIPVAVSDLAADTGFSVAARGPGFNVVTTSAHSVDRSLVEAFAPPGGANFNPGDNPISTTPGRTNPAFAPGYSR